MTHPKTTTAKIQSVTNDCAPLPFECDFSHNFGRHFRVLRQQCLINNDLIDPTINLHVNLQKTHVSLVPN